MARPRRVPKNVWQARHPNAPKGGYGRYWRAFNRKTGAPREPGQPVQPTYDSLLRSVHLETPAQLQKRANQMAKVQFVAGRNAARAEAKMMRDEAQRRMTAMSQAGQTAAEMSQRLLTPAVGAEYGAASQELARLGGGLTGAMQRGNEMTTQQTNEALARVGAPGITGSSPQAAVELYRGTTLPALNMVSQGNIAQFGLANQIETGMKRSTHEAGAAFQEAVREANNARSSAIRELAAGRPQNAATFLSALEQANSQARDSAMSILAARQTFGLQRQGNLRETNAARLARLNAARQHKLALANLDIARDAARRAGSEINEDASAARGWYIDVNGNFLRNNKGGKIKYRPGATGGSDSADAPVTWQDYQKDVATALYHTVRDATADGGTLTRPTAIKVLQTRFPKKFWPNIRAYINALPASTFTRKASESGLGAFLQGGNKGTTQQRAK